MMVLIAGLWFLWPRISPRIQYWREEREKGEANQFRRLLTSVNKQDWSEIHLASNHWLDSLPNNRISSLQQFAKTYGSSDLRQELTILLASKYSQAESGETVSTAVLTNRLKEARARFFSKSRHLKELPPLN